MDDLNGAIAAIESSMAVNGSASAPSIPLEDGEGKYTLIGLVSHIGNVAHLKKDGKWVIFNDGKVRGFVSRSTDRTCLHVLVCEE